MINLRIQSDSRDNALELISSAIAAETARLELGLKATERHIRAFEERYHTDSDTFLRKLGAEDLEGGDKEYVAWAGELNLRQRIAAQLESLKSIRYAA